MKIIRAQAMGMCFGVNDALFALDSIQNPDNTTIYGELVHNEQVNTALADRGFSILRENQRHIAPSAGQVVITAHGISNKDRQRLLATGKSLIDTTCPLVRRVHDTALHLQSEGWFIIVVGQPKHVEVLGIIGDLEDFAVVARVEDVRDFGHKRLAIVCQTTTRPAVADQIAAAIHTANPASTIRFVDTICRPTRERQLAVEKLVQMVDALVVVGGAHSNNTRQLASLAQQHGLPVAHVQSSTGLQPDWVCAFETIGLTAGTSTLASTIEEVHGALLSIANARAA